jgi:hypothetical protein
MPDSRPFSHDLLQMTGYYSIFDHQRWESNHDLQRERVMYWPLRPTAAVYSWTPS